MGRGARNWRAGSCGRNGYKILYRNFRGRSGGEIDIVCRDRDTLVFVEVKTRTREDFGRPFDAVDRDKQKRIARGGLAWLRLLDDPDILFRFDVVEVIIAEGADRGWSCSATRSRCPSRTFIEDVEAGDWPTSTECDSGLATPRFINNEQSFCVLRFIASLAFISSLGRSGKQPSCRRNGTGSVNR